MNESNSPEKINLIARKWQDGTITDLEKQQFEDWYADFDNELEIYSGESREETERRLYNLIAKKGNIAPKRQSKWPRIAVAAAILFSLGIGSYYYSIKPDQPSVAQLQINDIAPGGNKAVLTLANGQQIVLTNAKNGQLAVQGNSEITKTADGDIVYQQTKGQTALATLTYNTVSTPVGGQYHLTLADGTNVWLNAASSIKFPSAFTGNERKVEITGEAYFEVAHNAAKPFRVQSNQQVVEVLGTHFNVNSYADENATKTTLLEGSVKVTGSNGFKLIKPGQQAVLSGNNLSIAQADVEEAVAWKNGYFRFNDEKIESVMRKLSRWYNIAVTFEGKTSDEGFNGKISRYKNISQALKMLEKTKAVHFKVEGRRVTVTQ
ncbi:FecR family protein [Mucilaginibacter sp. UYCu711]|uniref:FecR family protein n=1 Tax=Mucilaginibacter sp. UYCu711 TaxID=3156339 RepID=UPI003D193573